MVEGRGGGGGVMLLLAVKAVMAVVAVMAEVAVMAVVAVLAVMVVVLVSCCSGRHHLLMPKHVKIHGLAPPHDGVSGHLLLPALVRSAGAVGGVKRGAFLLGRF